MNKLVTIGLPIYKRLNYLPNVLKIVSAQDYPAIELIVSDNGENGSKVRELVDAHYQRPYRFRQNPATVEVAQHFNQILAEASGEYYSVLSDDDELTPTFVSELVDRLERHPKAVVGYGRQEFIDKDGNTLRRSKDTLPEVLTGEGFLRAIWQTYEFGFEAVGTYVARTDVMRKCGGWPSFTRGNHIDDGLVLKLCLNGGVVLSSKCAFRWRIDEASLGWSVPVQDLAAASREFLRFLEDDAMLRQFARSHPTAWREIKSFIVRMTWFTYLERWRDMYRRRLPRWQWAKAAFALPWIRPYYSNVGRVLLREFCMGSR